MPPSRLAGAQAEPPRRAPVPTTTGKRPAKTAPAPARVILIKATKPAPSLDLDALAKSLAPPAKAIPPRPKAAEALAKAPAAPRKPACTEAPNRAAALLCANPSARLARADEGR